jgi:hypothetical protein
MTTTKNAQADDNALPLWSGMRRCDFDASVPLTLFDMERDATAPVKADKCGTPDLFSDWA